MLHFPATRLRRTMSTTYNFNTLFDTNHLTLPRLPIPDLEDTLVRYENSAKALCENEDDFAHTKSVIEKFRTSGGHDLQQLLLSNDKAQAEAGGFPHFYFEDLWMEAYLAARCPNPININPTFFMPTKVQRGAQTARAAEMLSTCGRWLVHAKNGSLANDGLDMSRLGRIMGTARLPGKDVDTLEYYASTSTHVVIQSKGGAFHKVEILTADGSQALSISVIEASLNQILASESDLVFNRCRPGVGVLTSMERPKWWEARKELIASDMTGTNEQTLQTIDSALLMVALDDLDTDNVVEYCRSGLHGVNEQTRSDRWWDKIQLLVDPSGRVGWHFEHSFSDGLSWNRWLGEIWHAMGHMDTPPKWVYGELPPAASAASAASQGVSQGISSSQTTELTWNLNTSLKTKIANANEQIQRTSEKLDTVATTFNDFGKNEIKAMGYSPDAFVQMSYQLAYSNLHDGAAAPTYEACSTAKHFHGRTETIRSCSPESRLFVNSFQKETSGNSMMQAALSAATTRHSMLSKEAASGLGVDRHLMALGVLAKQSDVADAMELFNDPLYS